jgi:hypothetical protein
MPFTRENSERKYSHRDTAASTVDERVKGVSAGVHISERGRVTRTEQATHGVDLDQAGRVAVVVDGRRGGGVQQKADVAELRVVDERLEVRREVGRLAGLLLLRLASTLGVGEQQTEAARLEIVLLAPDPLGRTLVAVDAEVQVAVAAVGERKSQRRNPKKLNTHEDEQ